MSRTKTRAMPAWRHVNFMFNGDHLNARGTADPVTNEVTWLEVSVVHQFGYHDFEGKTAAEVVATFLETMEGLPATDVLGTEPSFSSECDGDTFTIMLSAWRPINEMEIEAIQEKLVNDADQVAKNTLRSIRSQKKMFPEVFAQVAAEEIEEEETLETPPVAGYEPVTFQPGPGEWTVVNPTLTLANTGVVTGVTAATWHVATITLPTDGLYADEEADGAEPEAEEDEELAVAPPPNNNF